MGNPDDEIKVLPPSYEESKEQEIVETIEQEEGYIVEFEEGREPTDEELATLRRVSEKIPLRAWFSPTNSQLISGLWLSWNYANVSRSTDVKVSGATTLKTPLMILIHRVCWVLGLKALWEFKNSSRFELIRRRLVGQLSPISIGGGIRPLYGAVFCTSSVRLCLYALQSPWIQSPLKPTLADSSRRSLSSALEPEVVLHLSELTEGIKSNVSALVAEQCTGSTRFLKRIGEEIVIVDPAVTAQRIYMYFYFAINIGSLGSILTTLLEHNVGFWSAYLLPLCAFAVALTIVIWGKKRYVLRKPQGSILLDFFKATWIALQNGRSYEAAKPANHPGVRWDDQFIEELKRALVACKVYPG